jgi:hypothetical protein
MPAFSAAESFSTDRTSTFLFREPASCGPHLLGFNPDRAVLQANSVRGTSGTFISNHLPQLFLYSPASSACRAGTSNRARTAYLFAHLPCRAETRVELKCVLDRRWSRTVLAAAAMTSSFTWRLGASAHHADELLDALDALAVVLGWRRLP